MPTGTGDAIQISNGSATTAQKALLGGNYALTASAIFGGGNLQLQILAFDGTTWLNVGASVTAAGYVAFPNLPPGQYRIAITTATAVFAALVRVPS